MARVLITGMSGAGKSTLLAELARRGHTTIDTDDDGWKSDPGTWDEPRMTALLASESDVFVSGTAENQGAFYDRFAHVVLLSAPIEVLIERVSARTNNPYGRLASEQADIRRYVREVEPLLRRGASLELDGRLPVAELADRVEHAVAAAARRDAPWPRGLLPDDGAEWVAASAGDSAAIVLHDVAGLRYVKIVTPAGEAELAAERDRTTWLARTGIPTGGVLDWHSSATGAYLMTRRVPGVSADRLDGESLLRAWPSIVEAVRALHDLPVAECPFEWGVNRMLALARATVAEGRVHTEFLPTEVRSAPPTEILAGIEAESPARLAQERASRVVCHGDLCLPNIVIDSETHRVTGLIDVGRLGRADPYVDIALLLANARGTWRDEATARRADLEFARRYGAPLDAERRDFYERLDPLTW